MHNERHSNVQKVQTKCKQANLLTDLLISSRFMRSERIKEKSRRKKNVFTQIRGIL